MNKEQVLQGCTIDGNIVKLPEGQLERKLYQDAAKSLTLIGGKWKGGKVMGFVFPNDPTELLAQIANGEKRNLKKEFQFFATPEELADKLVDLAFTKPVELGKILEPSAGQGAIIKAIHKYDADAIVRYCELMDINQTILKQNCSNNIQFLGSDFFDISIQHSFLTIIANPPFAKNQDIDHIYRMYELLEHGGRLVSIASKHWVNSERKKEADFSDWLDGINAEIIDIPKGAFKESGTMISACIIVINK